MYKIYINEKLVILTDDESKTKQKSGFSTIRFDSDLNNSDIDSTLNFLKSLASSKGAFIVHRNLQHLWKTFRSHFTLVVAGGGIVTNRAGKLLVIYRRGHWDLPKGKIDKNEDIQSCAVREVKEECGLSNIDLGDLVCSSFHVYEEEGDDILKESFWFHMSTNQETLTPQAEEDIEIAKWEDPKTFVDEYPNIFPNIRDIVIHAFALNPMKK